MKSLALILSTVAVTGCVTTKSTVNPQQPAQSSSSVSQFVQTLVGPGPGLAAHDPSPGTPLFSQIPAWDDAAEKRCCSVLPRDEFLKMRCDTNQPLGHRTNRC